MHPLAPSRLIAGPLALGLALATALPARAQPELQAGPQPDVQISGPLAPVTGATLRGVVLMSRHGMRGPTKGALCPPDAKGEPGCLDALSQQPWPTLGVAAGHLTRAGYERAVTMGRFYRGHYAGEAILPAQGCPAGGTVAFISDAVERTVMTAGAVADGMFPGCDIPALAIHPGLYEGPACGYDAAEAARATQALAGGSWKALAEGELKEPLAAMSRVLGPLPDATCAAQGAAPGCTLAGLPLADAASGPIGLASQPAEQFVMQYGAGTPDSEVAWGRLPAAAGRPLADAIAYVNAVHAANDRFVHMARYQAVKRGSAVLYPLLQALDGLAAGHGPRFTFFAGHDNYMLNVGGMLGLSWSLPSYNPEQVPPGGAFAFELWQPQKDGKAEGEPLLRLVYIAQTLDQLHDDRALTPENPPAAQLMPVPGCPARADGACGWSTFRAIAAGAIDMTCVDPQRMGPHGG